MALDNEKLSKVINTTEKLMGRMDAMCAKRDARKDADVSEKEKQLKTLRRELESGAGPWKTSHERTIKKLEKEIAEAKREDARKDDYGHPVKGDNRVQQTDYGKE